jgi:hypothetical protein
MTPLLADPTFWNVVIGLGALSLGWLARHMGAAPAPKKPAPSPVPDSPLPGVAGQAILAMLKALLERQQMAQATGELEALLAHLPSTVKAPAVVRETKVA